MADLFVVDCSVAAKWVLTEPGEVEAFDLLDRQDAGEVSLIAPELIRVEMASLIAKRTRRKQMSIDEALHAFHLAEEAEVELFETRPLLARALELALRHHMSLWDCVYIALAMERQCSLITADRRLFNAGRGRHPVIRLLHSRLH